MEESELEMAKRHVREAEDRVARQRELIAQLRRDNHDTTQADKLLMTFEAALASHRDSLEVVTREFEGKV